MLAIVVVIGTALLFPGLSAIEEFRDLIEVEDYKRDSSRESLIIEHVRFVPTSQNVEISIRNIGTISAIVDTVTIVKIDTQDLVINDIGVNQEIFPKFVLTTTRDASGFLGADNWNSGGYEGESYRISITTARGNSFETTAEPFNT